MMDDVALEAKYTAIGRMYSAQRRFREMWVAEALELEQTQRLQREDISYESTMTGIYYPAMQIVEEEGGGDSGIEAAANYIVEAVRRFKLNETLNSKP